MNIEIYSIRTKEADTSQLNDSFDSMVASLAKDGLKVIFKTEVDPSGPKISKALQVSTSDSERPDMIVIANALTTTDSGSFRQLFADTISALEKKHQPAADKKAKTMLKKKVKIHSLGDFGSNYKGYCFMYEGVKVVVLPLSSMANTDIELMVQQGITKANTIFSAAQTDYPDGFTQVEAKREKKGFYKSVFPQSNDTGFEKLRKTIVLFAVVVFLVAAGFLINNLIIEPARNNQAQMEIQQIFYEDDGKKETDPDTGKNLTKNWDNLKKVNTDIVGWIQMDNTVINYPVLENKSDTSTYQYYLTHDYKKDYSSYGSIFLDYRCKDSVKSKNLILHGHHMNDGSMFGNLLNYGTYEPDMEFYRKASTLNFDTPESNAVWKVISVFKTNTLDSHGTFFNYMQSSFNSDAEFMNFVYNVKIRSMIDIPVTVNEDDQLLTLSTCSYEYTEFRTVVVLRKVRENENYSVDVSKAKVNSNVVWPQVYYSNRGGTRPTVTTFKTALEAGDIDWYDGKGNLEGKETLTGSTGSPSSSGNSNEKITYTVTFINYDGTELKTQEVEEGKNATPPADPKKPETSTHTFRFDGWQLDYSDVVCDMTIAPNFTAVPK